MPVYTRVATNVYLYDAAHEKPLYVWMLKEIQSESESEVQHRDLPDQHMTFLD